MKISSKKILKRSDSYSIVFQALNLLAKGKESELLIFNLWGGVGSGKTFALNEIANRAKELEGIKVLGPYNVSEYDNGLLDQLHRETADSGEQSKKLILLDDLGSLVRGGGDENLIPDLEDKLISPVIATGDTIVVITSLHEIRQWRSVEVRMRHRSILIPPLDKGVFRKLVKDAKLNYAIASEKTLGNPKLLEWLASDPSLDIDELDKKAVEFFLDKLEPETRKIARVMSLCPSFNVPAFQRATNVVDLRSGNSYFSDLALIKEMGSIGLIFYESRTGMYHFSDPIARSILARSFRREFPEQAAAVHKVLADLFIRESSYVNALSSHLLNAIYHQSWTAKFTDFSLSNWIDYWFSEMDTIWQNANWNEVNYQIAETLSNKYLLDELRKIVSSEEYSKVIHKIRPIQRNVK
jgi:hypothetical protein